jgi:hypothetical protein
MILPAPRARAEETGKRFFDFTNGGKAAAVLVVPEDDAPLWADATAMITAVAKRWGGTPPRLVRLAKDARLPEGNLILLGTPETSRTIRSLGRPPSPVARLPFADRHAFAIESQTVSRGRRLIIAGRRPRGAYNGAVYCRDFLLDASPGMPGKANVYVRSASVFRAPAMKARGTYHLSLYGVAMKYTAEDWMKIIDRYAEDGMERVFFWLSGHHPSAKYPHLYHVDSARGGKLTVSGVRRLIRYCHDRDIKFYIGGGVFAWTASHFLIKDHPKIAAVKAAGLCPSKAFARLGNREHFLEMYDTWPEADGFMFEVRDEHGECRCADCRVKLDRFGSRAYGRAEITWLQEFARAAWKRNRRLRFCWLIGYAEHRSDVDYYVQIRRMSDRRFEWLDTRVGLDLDGKWVLPGPANVPRPFAFFSKRIAHWDQFYRLPVDRLLRAARLVADEGLYGYVPAFEPGFSTASYYAEEIPLPVHSLPYCLTGFAYREATWDPTISVGELKRRVRLRYFSPNAPERFTEDMIYLHQFSLDHWSEITAYARPKAGFVGERVERLTVEGERKRVQAIPDAKQRKAAADQLRATFAKLAGVPAHLTRMGQIEAAIDKATPATTPKTREGMAILRRMITDTRKLYKQAVPDPRALAKPIR